MSKYIKISSNLRKEISRLGIAKLRELSNSLGPLEGKTDKLVATKIAARELDFHFSARCHLGEEEAKEGILRSLCQQFRNLEDSKKGFDIYEFASGQEIEAANEKAALDKLTKVTIAENSNEPDPLAALAASQPQTSQEFNDIMSALAIEVGASQK